MVFDGGVFPVFACCPSRARQDGPSDDAGKDKQQGKTDERAGDTQQRDQLAPPSAAVRRGVWVGWRDAYRPHLWFSLLPVFPFFAFF